MKKVLLILIVTVSIMGLFKDKVGKVIIPQEAIRFRVIANSNREEDQALKMKIRDELQEQMTKTLEGTKTIDQARKKMLDSLSLFDEVVKKETKKVEEVYKLDYGIHYFPKKVYRGVEYPEGNYESLVVTLGDGLGDNWWCVLFPPLCLLEAEETMDSTEVEYKFFIQELLENFNKS